MGVGTKSATNEGEQYGFIADSSGTPVKYVYNLDSGDWTSYIYQDSQWSESGTGYTTSQLSELVPESERLYINRPAYRDAVVTGTQYVGGLVGAFTGSGNRLENNYNAGCINYSGSDAAADGIGGLVGGKHSEYQYSGELSMPKASEANGNFMVTTQNVTGKNVTGGYTDASGVKTSIPAVGKSPDHDYLSSDYEKSLYQAFQYKVEPPTDVKPDVKPTPDEKPDVKPTPDVKPDIKPTPDIKPDVKPVIPDNDPEYDIDFSQNDADYEAAKKARWPMDIRNKAKMVFHNAYVPDSVLTARHFTLEDTGVQLYDNHSDNSIVIDKSSRADGGETITIKRKAVVINNITMAE